MKKINPIARILRTGWYSKQIIKPAKGKGSYKRKPKHEKDMQ